MSATSKSAVSDYEHLNYRPTTGNIIGLNESEDDELFLKAPTPSALVGTLTCLLDENNSSSPIHTLMSKNSHFNHFETVNKNLPVPSSSWSPSMMLKSNPALLVTPEKTGNSTTSHANRRKEEQMLSYHELKNAPQPVPWSPGMRPEKSIFITPDKNDINVMKNKDNVNGVGNSQFLQTKSSNTLPWGTDKSGKEKQSVRFDLPSLSSGEDTFFDETSCLFSPVTINGTDLSPSIAGEEVSETSPPFSSLSSHDRKSYNPNVYSDDSTLDESLLTSQKSVPPSNVSQFQNDEVTLSTSAHLVNKLRDLMQNTDFSETATSLADIPSENFSTVDNTSNMKQSNPFTKSSKKSTKNPSTLSTRHLKDKNTQSSQIIVIKENQNKNKSHSHQNKAVNLKNKAGPHFLKDPISAYHPPSTGSCIVKEPQYQVDAQEYSYPFHDWMKGEDNEMEHAFARPEFNSTMKFRQELDAVCDQEIDLVRAVNEKLKQTISKSTEIHEKAAVLTNCASDQFTNLIDLDAPVDRLCDRVLRMRTSKAVKKKKMPSEKAAKRPTFNVPDLMEFYSPDLQKETPGFSLQGITPTTPDLLSASSELAFDGYRNSRVWEGLQDF